jgi:DNA polymerase I
VPQYSIGADCLFVAYYASAELGCHLALGWPMPARILDLFTEFRNQTNGLPTVAGRGLIGALAAYGLDSIGTIEKRRVAQFGYAWRPLE